MPLIADGMAAAGYLSINYLNPMAAGVLRCMTLANDINSRWFDQA